MIGLEPGDVTLPVAVKRFAEAEERAHLVDVAADVLGDPVEPADERVGAVLEQFRLGAQAG